MAESVEVTPDAVEPETAAPASEQASEAIDEAAPHVQPTPRIPRQPIVLTAKQKKFAIFGGSGLALLIVIVVVLALIPGLFSPLTAGQIPAYAKAFSDAQQKEQSEKICGQLKEAIPTAAEVAVTQKRVTALKTVSTFTNRQAQNFVNGADWAYQSDETGTLQASIGTVIDPALKTTASKAGILGLSSANADLAVNAWRTAFRDKALEVCGLSDAYKAASVAATDFDTSMETVQTLADSAPWYPEGYSEYDSTFAIKWTTHEGEWPCDNCNFWKIKVVSNTDCSNGVYGELNMNNDGGVTVDWTNDTVASLAAGQIAELVFENFPYNSSLAKGELVQLSCNQ